MWVRIWTDRGKVRLEKAAQPARLSRQHTRAEPGSFGNWKPETLHLDAQEISFFSLCFPH